jgi:hypothetical protein
MENQKLAQLLDVLRSAIGVPYLFSMSEDMPGDISGGLNCSGLFNWARQQIGLAPPPNFRDANGILRSGLGTMGYAQFLTGWWVDFDPNKVYPIGTLLVNDDVRFDENGNHQVDDFSHVAIVSSLPDADGNQWLIQSDHAGGITERNEDGSPLRGVPGVNESRTVAETIQVLYFDDANNDNPTAKAKGFFWAGEMPDVRLEPWE